MPHPYDPFSTAFRDDPYPHYRELRDREPVHVAPESKLWCVSRYEDVQSVLKRDEEFSSRAMFTVLMNNGQDEMPRLTPRVIRFIVWMFLRTRMNPFGFDKARNLIAEDGERHTGLRNIVNRGFTPRRIAAWEKRAREVAEECVAKLARRGEPFDLVEDLSVPLPVTIIAEMLGVEPSRHRDFKRWSDAVIHSATGPGRATPYSARFTRAMIDMMAYIKRRAHERRRAPADDVLSVIVAEQDGEAGLSDREVVQFVTLLLVAGNETTTNLIGNAVRALLANRAACERLAADPSLAPRVVEETLRYDPPVQMVFRNAKEDTEVAGERIPKGSKVAALIGSANRDERRFADPDRFDIDRETQGHIGFGFAKHFCLGSSLARLEARVALETLAPHLPRLRATTSPEMIDSFLVRGPKHLELRA